jgi:hypothetical protein
MRMKLECVVVCALLLFSLAAASEENENELEGSVELIYRDVSVDGSSRKYAEDFDDLDSGARLGSLSLHWLPGGSNLLDYVDLSASGLGGDPFERTSLRLGRKDSYELSVNHMKQSYFYNLFELEPDEDGHAWDTKRQMTDVKLKLHPTEKLGVLFRYEQGRRTGSSLFMKDIERELFQIDSPLDQTLRRYTVGANLQLGKADIAFQHSLRRYDNQLNSHTDDNLGIEEAISSLDNYSWMQDDSGETDWTSLRVHAPLGDRVNLTVAVAGTFLGDEEISSRVHLDAGGTTYEGVCSASGLSCESDEDCEPVSAIPGDVCIANPFSVTDGSSTADLVGDVTLIDADISVMLVDSLDFHLQYRSLDRDLNGMAERDLDGDGVSQMVDTRNDYAISTATALFDYRPTRKIRMRAGYRTIDREMIRNGFIGYRNSEYKSDDDTLIFGLNVKPTSWFSLNVDHEDGDIAQPLNASAAQDRKHTRIRSRFTPKKDMNIDLAYLDFENRNTAPDFRMPSSRWNSLVEGSTWSAAFWHKANKMVSYTFRYAEQEVDSMVGVVIDQDDFGGAVEAGDSIFNNDNTQYSGQVNLDWAEAWKTFVRYWFAEADGNNLLSGEISGVVNDRPLGQEFRNAEIGLTYSFGGGIFVGASLRDIDYDDVNDLLDYDGQIFTLRLGTTF